MPDHRIFQRLHRQLRETRSFYVARHDANRRRAVRSSRLEESILNVLADRPESKSSARGVAPHVSQQVPNLKPEDYLLRLPCSRHSNVRCSWTSYLMC
ncbi:hypothetical protein TNCV_2458921 [Trichonephila clavipes]|nr:hypothetical protein TNCV_2458921 [Trichonephila clavipes]